MNFQYYERDLGTSAWDDVTPWDYFLANEREFRIRAQTFKATNCDLEQRVTICDHLQHAWTT